MNFIHLSFVHIILANIFNIVNDFLIPVDSNSNVTSSVKEFFNEIGKLKYKNELSENLIDQVSKAYTTGGLDSVSMLLERIHEKYMGKEENES